MELPPSHANSKMTKEIQMCTDVRTGGKWLCADTGTAQPLRGPPKTLVLHAGLCSPEGPAGELSAEPGTQARDQHKGPARSHTGMARRGQVRYTRPREVAGERKATERSREQ